KEAAQKADRESRRRLGQIEKANEILGSIFEKLDPKAEEKDGKPLRAILGERLDKATAHLDEEAIGDPLTVATLQYRLAEPQLGLGYPHKAIALFSKAAKTRAALLGKDHPRTLECLRNLAEAYWADWQRDEAFRLFDQVLRLRKARLGDDHADTLE